MSIFRKKADVEQYEYPVTISKYEESEAVLIIKTGWIVLIAGFIAAPICLGIAFVGPSVSEGHLIAGMSVIIIMGYMHRRMEASRRLLSRAEKQRKDEKLGGH